MSKPKEEADATKELVQKITQKIFSKSYVDRDEVRSIISKIFKDYKVELKQMKEENKLHKGISDSKSIIINQLEEEIRILKQYSEIARNDKHQRKIRLNEALEEIKQLKNK